MTPPPSTTQPQKPRQTSPLPVIIALFVLVVIGAAFIGELASVSGDAEERNVEATLVPASYMDELTPLLADANPMRGEALVQRYGCTVCHTGPGAANRLAPLWDGIGTRAETRRPPLSAAAYIYESIIHPRAFEVEGYSGNMPLIYDRTIEKADLGDIIAYLLTLTE